MHVHLENIFGAPHMRKFLVFKLPCFGERREGEGQMNFEAEMQRTDIKQQNFHFHRKGFNTNRT